MRKPFGEMTTNTPPSKRKHEERTPLKQQSTPNNNANSSSGNNANTFTPLANLKLLMNVAASENAEFGMRPSRYERTLVKWVGWHPFLDF